jgi:transcriptional regulator of heat shock response
MVQAITPRQQQLLVALVGQYISQAEPVSSHQLVGHGLDYSSATIRNDLVALEEAGYLRQPHTSAGRAPTELGYRFYVGQLPSQPSLPRSLQSQLERVVGAGEENLKALAQVSSRAADAAVFVAFRPYNYYYTGLSSVFSRPEFVETSLVCSLAEVLDHLGSTLEQLWDDVGEVDVRIGSACPFGRPFATVVGRTASGSLFGILGPQRLDYGLSRGIVSFVTSHS